MTGYLGINFVLVLVRSFGALLAVTGQCSTYYAHAAVVVLFSLHSYCSDYVQKVGDNGAFFYTLLKAIHNAVSF